MFRQSEVKRINSVRSIANPVHIIEDKNALVSIIRSKEDKNPQSAAILIESLENNKFSIHYYELKENADSSTYAKPLILHTASIDPTSYEECHEQFWNLLPHDQYYSRGKTFSLHEVTTKKLHEILTKEKEKSLTAFPKLELSIGAYDTDKYTTPLKWATDILSKHLNDDFYRKLDCPLKQFESHSQCKKPSQSGCVLS